MIVVFVCLFVPCCGGFSVGVLFCMVVGEEERERGRVWLGEEKRRDGRSWGLKSSGCLMARGFVGGGLAWEGYGRVAFFEGRWARVISIC